MKIAKKKIGEIKLRESILSCVLHYLTSQFHILTSKYPLLSLCTCSYFPCTHPSCHHLLYPLISPHIPSHPWFPYIPQPLHLYIFTSSLPSPSQSPARWCSNKPDGNAVPPPHFGAGWWRPSWELPAACHVQGLHHHSHRWCPRHLQGGAVPHPSVSWLRMGSVWEFCFTFFPLLVHQHILDIFIRSVCH